MDNVAGIEIFIFSDIYKSRFAIDLKFDLNKWVPNMTVILVTLTVVAVYAIDLPLDLGGQSYSSKATKFCSLSYLWTFL